MSDFTYTAKRSIQSGHIVDTDYLVTMDLQKLDRRTKPIVKVVRALSGEIATTRHRTEIRWRVKTGLVNIAGGALDADDMREFLDSVDGGEIFTFNNGADQEMTLDGSYMESRVGPLHYQYSFTLLES